MEKEKLMLHIDYSWDLHPWGIKFDEELNIDKLGWKNGDMFVIKNIDGQAMLTKVDPVVAFTNGYKVNCND